MPCLVKSGTADGNALRMICVVPVGGWADPGAGNMAGEFPGNLQSIGVSMRESSVDGEFSMARFDLSDNVKRVQVCSS